MTENNLFSLYFYQKFTSLLSEGLKDGGAKKDMLFSFENCGNTKMTGFKSVKKLVLFNCRKFSKICRFSLLSATDQNITAITISFTHTILQHISLARSIRILIFHLFFLTTFKVVIDGKKKGSIQSPTLCKAFTSVYLE